MGDAAAMYPCLSFCMLCKLGAGLSHVMSTDLFFLFSIFFSFSFFLMGTCSIFYLECTMFLGA